MFKKQFFVALCLFTSSFIAHSQASETPIKYNNNYLDKGTWLIGGNLSYLNSSGADILYGSLSGAKMISKNVALGANILYVSSGSNTILGPQARYYFNNERSSKFFLLGNVNFNTEGGSPNYSVGAGLANFVSDYVSIDITGNYGNSFNSNNLSSSRSNLISLLVGLQIYLPKKKQTY
ncbi:hypothetical protein VB796_07135 [Arcicella sp. LKC2W]|uniref:hypothetical protein n=1 Tax=Arcicella sp. LKC2W TaxID=2984198 RepID=UPI002B20F251|nr:hypothetical protein [Arcicella sp. LKC2W]MEA5458803.1 hypothetical protein [Arcicella sp. LKC2W]